MSFVTKTNHKRVLYVGGLEKGVTEVVLSAAFVPFGPVKDVQVPMDYTGKTPKNKGHGFVEFVSEDDAKEAMDNMDDSELYGKVIKVTIAKPQSALRPDAKRAVWDEHVDEDHVLETTDDAAAKP